MPKKAESKKTPATKVKKEKVVPKVIKKAPPKAEKKVSAASTPKVLSKKNSVEQKKQESLKS